jgi:hypothetical protein
MKLKHQILLLFAILSSENIYSEGVRCIEKIENDKVFKSEVEFKLHEGEQIFYCDTLKYIERLISVFQGDKSLANYLFINLKFNKLTTKNFSSNASIARRKDFAILLYIHFFVLYNSGLNKEEYFFIESNKSEIFGGFLIETEEYKDQIKVTSRSLRKIYKRMKRWINYVERKKYNVDKAKKNSRYPFNTKYKWRVG